MKSIVRNIYEQIRLSNGVISLVFACALHTKVNKICIYILAKNLSVNRRFTIIYFILNSNSNNNNILVILLCITIFIYGVVNEYFKTKKEYNRIALFHCIIHTLKVSNCF